MTGKFRKVASHYASEASLWAVPKLAMGRLPLGTPARQWRK